MRREFFFLVIACCALCVSAFAQERKADEDKKAIQGTWDIESVSVNGEPADWPITYTFIDEKVSVIHKTLGTKDGHFILNSQVMPHQIDLVFKEPDGRVTHMKGLYAWGPNRHLELCFSSGGLTRPPKMIRKAQKGVNVVVLKQ